MTENKNTIPEISENKPLADEQLEEVTGGFSVSSISAANMVMGRRCAANPDHSYTRDHDACPYCGCKESTPC